MQRYVFFLFLVLTTCNSAESFKGKIAGQTLTVNSMAFGTASLSIPTGNTSPLAVGLGMVLLSNNEDICRELGNKAVTHNDDYLYLGLVKVGSLTTGIYTAQDPNTLAINPPMDLTDALAGLSLSSLVVNNPACQNSLAASQSNAVAGSVMVNSLNTEPQGAIEGTYSLSVGTQHDAVSGTFHAATCANLSALLQAGSTAASANSTYTFPLGMLALPCE